MNYPGYLEYRDSKVTWLGKLPLTWKAQRLKDVIACPITDGPHLTPEFHYEGIPFLSVDGIQNGELQFEGCRFVSEQDHILFSQKVAPKKNDILLGKAASTGKIAQVKVDFEFSIWSPLALIRPDTKQVTPTFLEYALKSPIAQAQIDVLCTHNTQSNISMDDIPKLTFPIPPMSEQRQIAAFLDWKTSQMDALIAKKQTLLQKLKEKRLAVITQAVTKGLNPKAPMRDSGSAWLGDVPAHWEVKRLKWAIMLQRGHDLPADERGQGDVPLVSSAGVSALHDVAIAKAPGIVTGRYGTIGVFHLIEEDYWPLNTTLYSIDMFGNSPKFLRALLESLSPLFLLNSKKSAVPGVDRNDVHVIKVALPSVEEQIQIAAYISTTEDRHEQVTKNAEAAIARLNEYRSAVITGV